MQLRIKSQYRPFGWFNVRFIVAWKVLAIYGQRGYWSVNSGVVKQSNIFQKFQHEQYDILKQRHNGSQ
jgi:hypothetical protein